MKTTLFPLRQRLLWGILILILAGNAATILLTKLKSKGGAQWTMPKNFQGVTSHVPTNRTPEGSELAIYGEAPDFALTERSKRPFSKKELLGRPWIADFIFTSCAMQCPLMSAQMRRLQDEFSPKTGVQFVSFTVDPKRDTPEVLSEYADRFAAEKDRWFFLTGKQDPINQILKGFHLSGVDEPAMHSTRFILIDSKGQIRGYYDSTDPGAIKQLIYDVNLLLKEKP